MNGDNITYPSGMVRGSLGDKVNFLLVRDGPMLARWARLLTIAAPDKGERNWMKAHTEGDLKRFLESLDRHVAQYQNGETDEDHAASILFNVNGAEYVRERLRFKEDPCPSTLTGIRCLMPRDHVPNVHRGVRGNATITWSSTAE